MSRKVAIIGTGPSGMAAAQVLVNEGYKVKMFEKEDRAGGILMYGIPHMKLNKFNLQKKTDRLLAAGVEIVLNTRVTKDEVADTISKEFDAVLIATGSEKARDIKIDGRKLKNIYFAMEYLKDNTKHILDGSPLKIDAKNQHVVVIGGGDTSNDCVATAISQGAASVKQLEITPKDPTRKKNYYDFDDDDVKMYEKTAVRFLDCDGCVNKIIIDDVSFVKNQDGVTLEFKDQKGEIEADLVFVAIGFLGPYEEALEAFDVKLDRNVHNKDTTIFTTEKENIFICGDARRGQSLIKWAIQEGKMAAEVIKDYFNA